jgi:polysaccharide pyruvyl transferase WcaK-like protein
VPPFKTNIKALIETALVLSLSIFFKLFKLFNRDDKVGILPGSGVGSAGDEAMVIGLSKAINVDIDSFWFIDYQEDERWGEKRLCLFVKRFKLWPVLIYKLTQLNWLFINGADVLDGRYSFIKSYRRILIAIAAGIILNKRVVITGFSFNTEAPTALKLLLKMASLVSHLKIRDEKSYDRLAKMPRTLVSDMAFLLPAKLNSTDAEVYTKIKELRQNGFYFVAFNMSIHALRSLQNINHEDAVAKYIPIVTKQMKKVLDSDAKSAFLFLPHDTREGNYSDFKLLCLIKELLGDAYSHRVIVKSEPLDPRSLKFLVGQAQRVITGRKHLAVAALGQGVPVMGFGYNNKFEGLFKRYGLSKFICVIGSKNWAIHLEELLTSFTSTSDALRPKLEQVAKHDIQWAYENITPYPLNFKS